MNYITELRIYTDKLREQSDLLRKAIEEGVYDSRSIVGDVTLRLEASIKGLEKTITAIEKR
jgi:hypothetical protein